MFPARLIPFLRGSLVAGGGRFSNHATVVTGGSGTSLGIGRQDRWNEMGCGRGIDLLRALISSIMYMRRGSLWAPR